MKIKIAILYFFTLLASQNISAQSGTDLWIIQTTGKGNNFKLLPETAKALTDRPAYDNQPDFINEYQLVFSAADEEGNHDIIVYNFDSDKFTNLSKTSDRSEFSPRITDCGMYISAVVMEEDKKQRIWLYPTNFEPAELLYDDINPVGYYDWYDNKAAMFVLGEPNKLIYANGRDDLIDIDSQIGRSIQRRPKTSEITYLSTEPAGNQAIIKSYDIESGEREAYFEGLEGAQDFIWIGKKHLLMASANEIFIRKYNTPDWKSLGKIELTTHQNITRMAYSEDLDVLVVAMDRN
ncbi:hypothetical protein PBT90_07315 [Algoriphagus halophytocola]|uniref:WD40 repeat domain-containing protein n=1 Tax=Algoriphagus halophytocola TaxID=2991499 RepID=A0ABY6MLD8_9BACT|nr:MULTISPECIES: hypothetical protein [unclassified Algoriphagus]UZD23197.1 hypothetical protein OM944_01635 [Algoriphagus sp. TR-M5]WBL44490.1 hypothetical protein PBT90_07315 [Algoriphagus sp. TR-M9]